MSFLPINHVYVMDYKDFLPRVQPESVDLAIIDPPYNLKVAAWDTFSSHEEFLCFTYDWIDKLLPTLKKTASLYIFNTPYNCAYILQYLVQKGLKYQNWITWDKRDGFSAHKKRYNTAQESILFFTVSDKYTFNADPIRVPYEFQSRIQHAAKKGILKNGKRWFPNPNGKLCTDVWHIEMLAYNKKILESAAI